MNANQFFKVVISLFLLSTIMLTEETSAQVPMPVIPIPHPSRSDEIQDPGELGWYFRWLSDRIEVTPPHKGPGPPRDTILDHNGSFWSNYRIIDGEDRYDLGISPGWGGACPQTFEQFLTHLQNKNYRIKYIAIRKNTIFTLFGSLYCLDRPIKNPTSSQNVTSAFRIFDSDIPPGLTLQRRSIVFPICEDVKNYQDVREVCQYDGLTSEVYIVGYGQSPNPSEGPRVKMVNSLLSLEEQRRIYEERKRDYENPSPERKELWKKLNYPPTFSPKMAPWSNSLARKGVKEGWYQIGDIVPFQTVAHKIINIVLPDKEDCRIVHRKNKDGSITELKCRLSGWVELDPTPIPINKD